MVPKEEFERVRALLAAALEEAFKDYTVKPVELFPGWWDIWPARMLHVVIEEPQYRIYGVPYAATGNLRAHITNSYSKENIPLKNLNEAKAERVAQKILQTSKFMVDYYHYGPEKERAYLEAAKAVQEASDEERERLWAVRRLLWDRGHRGQHWERFHELVRAFLKLGHYSKSVFDWRPSYAEIKPVWIELREQLSDDDLYDTAMRGFADALDDWAASTGRLNYAEKLTT